MNWWRDLIAALIVLVMVAVLWRHTYLTRRRNRREAARIAKRLKQEQEDPWP